MIAPSPLCHVNCSCQIVNILHSFVFITSEITTSVHVHLVTDYFRFCLSSFRTNRFDRIALQYLSGNCSNSSLGLSCGLLRAGFAPSLCSVDSISRVILLLLLLNLSSLMKWLNKPLPHSKRNRYQVTDLTITIMPWYGGYLLTSDRRITLYWPSSSLCHPGIPLPLWCRYFMVYLGGRICKWSLPIISTGVVYGDEIRSPIFRGFFSQFSNSRRSLWAIIIVKLRFNTVLTNKVSTYTLRYILTG